jgi:hypothetical protein
MSMTLILWKAPVTRDADEVERLIRPYREHADDSAFEASGDLARFTDDLLTRYPAPDGSEPGDGPWADGLTESDRVVMLSIRWSADNAFIDAIVELARKHDLVLYDPQGSPDVALPGDPVSTGPVAPPGVLDHLKVVGIGIVGVGLFWLGRSIDVPVLEWMLMISGGFVVSVVVFLIWALLFGPREKQTTREA